MRAGVVSDTHGYTENLQRAAEWLEAEGVDLIIHLGDDASDLAELRGIKMPLMSVPGIFEPAYANEGVPNRITAEYDGIRVIISHTPLSREKDMAGDAEPEGFAAGGPGVILHGHSHIAGIEKEGSVTAVNPGHLKPSDGRGGGPSFAVVDFAAREVKIISLKDKSVIMRGKL